MYVVIEIHAGILDDVSLFTERETALRYGQRQWAKSSGKATMHEYRECTPEEVDEEEHDYDPEWGGVSRCWTMHWWEDDDEVFVVDLDVDVTGAKPEPSGDAPPLCQDCGTPCEKNEHGDWVCPNPHCFLHGR